MYKKVDKISSLVAEQIPGFIREDHPNFVVFLEAYYEWMETHKGMTDATRSLWNYHDLDETLDEYITFFMRTYMATFPEDILADPRKLLKHIKQFYRAKGSEKSFKLFFNILYESTTEFYYPHENMLRASDGKWQQDRTLKLFFDVGNPHDLEQTTITGHFTNSSAFVDNIIQKQIGPFTVYEAFLNTSSILGHFQPGETVFSPDGNTRAIVSSVFSDIEFETDANRGINFTAGDLIVLNGGSGVQGKAEIIDTSDAGGILRIKILNHGVAYGTVPDGTNVGYITHNDYDPDADYSSLTEEVLFITDSGSDVECTIIADSLAKYFGYYINDDGKLNSADRLQDGYFYQQFSYVTYVNQSIERYRTLIKNVIHPAGFIIFGGMRSTNKVDMPLKFGISAHVPAGVRWRIEYPRHNGIAPLPSHIENYIPDGAPLEYKPEHYNKRTYFEYNKCGPNLATQREWFFNPANDPFTDYHRWENDTETEVRLEITIKEAPVAHKMGPSVRSLERDKFWHKPTELIIDADQEVLGPNLGYWEEAGNAQLWHFEDVVIEDYEEQQYKKLNIQPEPTLRNHAETASTDDDIILSLFPHGWTGTHKWGYSGAEEWTSP